MVLRQLELHPRESSTSMEMEILPEEPQMTPELEDYSEDEGLGMAGFLMEIFRRCQWKRAHNR